LTVESAADRQARRLTEDIGKSSIIVVDEFQYQDGDRTLIAIYNDGRLLLRSMTKDGVSCAVNLDATGVHRLAISLSKFLEIHKLNGA